METVIQQDNQLTTTSILKLFETNKEERQSFVSDLVQRINAGYVNPLEIHLQVKCMEDIIKLLNTNTIYKDCLITEASKEGKSFLFHNAKFETKEAGVEYDFTVCKDVEWELLDSQMNSLKEKIKEREAFLKTVPAKGLTILDEETGEVKGTIYPPAKSSTTTVAVTLK